MINPDNCDSIKSDLYDREIEKKFCKVYGYVIWNFFDFKEDLISSAKEILNSKKERKKFDSDLSSYQLAFLLSFSVQDTCLSARKFYESIMNNPKIIRKLAKSNPMKLLCLESESLPTVIGVCQVINEIIKKFGSRGKYEIRILVVDNRENGKRLCGYVVDIANKYFTNTKLELDVVKDFVNWSFQEFNDRIQELDFFIIARFFAEDRYFNYSLIQTVLDEMKEYAILFYFDSCNEKFYDNLKEISQARTFSQVKSCLNLHASFEDLGDRQCYVDLPVSWDTHFQPVMFSTWIKGFSIQNDSFPEVSFDSFPITAYEFNLIKSKKTKKKSNRVATSNLSKCISNSKTTKTATNEQINVVIGKNNVKSTAKKCYESDALCGDSNIVIPKKKISNTTEQSNDFDDLRGQMNIVTGKKKINDMTQQCNDFATPSEQVNLVSGKEKVKAFEKHFAQSNCPKQQTNLISEATKLKTSTKHCNQSDPPSKQTDVVNGKKKGKSLTKLSNLDISTIDTAKTGASKAKKESCTQKSYEVLNTAISVLNKEIIYSRTANPSQKSQYSNVPCDAAFAGKLIAKTENPINSIKELGCESSVSYTAQMENSEGKPTSKISTSTSKIITTNQKDQTLLTKQTGNGSIPPPVLTASQKKKGKCSEMKPKSNTNAESTASKEFTESVDTKAPATTTPEVETEKTFRFNLPKKSSKADTTKTKKLNNTTEKIKLKGKFAHMDLEKKNKDERHKMRAKKASFAKHATFDYDD